MSDEGMLHAGRLVEGVPDDQHVAEALEDRGLDLENPEAPDVVQGKLAPFDPTADVTAEHERLMRATEARRERLLGDRGNRRLKALYREASGELQACRMYWRTLGELMGTRGKVSVVDNVVGLEELGAALADLPEDQRAAVLERLGLGPDGKKKEPDTDA